jgi:hypothetical protein
MGSEIGMKNETRRRDDELAAKRLKRLKRGHENLPTMEHAEHVEGDGGSVGPFFRLLFGANRSEVVNPAGRPPPAARAEQENR